MANNRMYLLHVPTGKAFYLAKYYPSTGWFRHKIDEAGIEMMEYFHGCDFCRLTQEQRAENAMALGFDTPYKASGGMFGNDYCLAYEGDARIKEVWEPPVSE